MWQDLPALTCSLNMDLVIQIFKFCYTSVYPASLRKIELLITFFLLVY